jgi:hypothetical protein
MAWELEHQELVGVEADERRPILRRMHLPALRTLALYGSLALAPILIFALMVVLARR